MSVFPLTVTQTVKLGDSTNTTRFKQSQKHQKNQLKVLERSIILPYIVKRHQ